MLGITWLRFLLNHEFLLHYQICSIPTHDRCMNALHLVHRTVMSFLAVPQSEHRFVRSKIFSSTTLANDSVFFFSKEYTEQTELYSF